MRRSLIFAALAAVLCLCAAAFAEEPCGEMAAAEPAIGVQRNDRYVAIGQGDGVFEFDIVRTDATGSGTIRFIDGTELTLRSSTEIAIKEVVSTETRSRFNVGIAEGAARIVTGAITRRNPRGFRATTPNGTIGIRGTDLFISHSDGVTDLTVNETEKTVSFTHRWTGVTITGGVGLQITCDEDGMATINGIACDLNDIESLTGVISTLSGVIAEDRNGRRIGARPGDMSGASAYGRDDNGNDGGGYGGGASDNDDGCDGCGAEGNSSPSR